MYVSIFGIDLSSLGMGPCARLRRLGAIVWVSLRRHEQIYRLGLGFRDSGRRGGSRGSTEGSIEYDTHVDILEARHIIVSIGYQLPSLAAGPWAKIRRLGAIVGHGAEARSHLGLGLGFK